MDARERGREKTMTTDVEGEGRLLWLLWSMDAKKRHEGEGRLLWWTHHGCKRERERETP